MDEALLLQKTEMLIEQTKDLQRFINSGDKIAWINFCQRRRFIACTYAKDANEAFQKLYELEALGPSQ